MGRLEQRNYTESRRDRGSVAAQHSSAPMPGSVGPTRGCMPYQDPVYSQPKKLPGTHFHNAACGPLRKLIPLCRRCTMMPPALYLSLCILWLVFLSFVSICFRLIFLSLLICRVFFLISLHSFAFLPVLTLELCHISGARIPGTCCHS